MARVALAFDHEQSPGSTLHREIESVLFFVYAQPSTGRLVFEIVTPSIGMGRSRVL